MPRIVTEQCLKRLKARRGDPVMMLARSRVSLDRPLPQPAHDFRRPLLPFSPHEDGPGDWKGLLDILRGARGCDYIACSRVAEDPEVVLFVIVWFDQESLDEFKASPEYTAFLVSLGTLSLEPDAGASIQTVKFLRWNGTNRDYLRGGISLFTAYATTFDRHPTRGLDPQHGWAQELWRVGDQTIQDGVFYKTWSNCEAEARMKRVVPEIEQSWEEELRVKEAIAAKEEHVNLMPVRWFEKSQNTQTTT
ncbi:hypothetical protein QBC46DRAFT_420743 [Diplogelasinospora grovesii]|uniref:ABM domain-containing protein n=1 Tax=Diplogelasinospora grovesii TaxID=303347 RepID=A0AAN6S7W6_9PEZI|nr:hypothetical protein QBC46DRAFT_420743 [Diplogelasinospora grovesii]